MPNELSNWVFEKKGDITYGDENHKNMFVN